MAKPATRKPYLVSAPTIHFDYPEAAYRRARQSMWLEFKGGDVPYPVFMRFALVRNQVACTGLVIGLADDEVREITSTSLRRLPLADFAWLVRTLAAEKVKPDPKQNLGKRRLPSIYAGVVEHSPSVTLPLPKPGKLARGPEFFAEVLSRYRQAVVDYPNEPVKRLADHYERERQTVKKWLKTARGNELRERRRNRRPISARSTQSRAQRVAAAATPAKRGGKRK
jgi:hypothetical protein